MWHGATTVRAAMKYSNLYPYVIVIISHFSCVVFDLAERDMDVVLFIL